MSRTDGNGFVDGDGFEIYQSEMIRIGQYDEYEEACGRYVPGALMITAGVLGTITGIGAVGGGPLTAGGAALIGFDLTCSIYSVSAGTAVVTANLAGSSEEAAKIPGSLPGVVGKLVDQAADTKVFEKALDLAAGVTDVVRSAAKLPEVLENVKEFTLFSANTGGLFSGCFDFLKNPTKNTASTESQTTNKKTNNSNHNYKPSALKISPQP